MHSFNHAQSCTKPPHGPNKDQILLPDTRESLLTDSNCLPRLVFCYHPWGSGCYGPSAIYPSCPSYVPGTSSQPCQGGWSFIHLQCPAALISLLTQLSRQKDETGVKIQEPSWIPALPLNSLVALDKWPHLTPCLSFSIC